MGDSMLKKMRLLSLLEVLAAVLLLLAAGLVFFYAPLEVEMGAVQKVFYFHVAAGWTGMLGFLAAAVCGILFLVKRERMWDAASFAGVEIGLVFTFINVVSGSIWARPIWNTWWTWDPRLTTAAIMILVYLAYLLLRSSLEDLEKRARFSAVYAVVGFISVPLTFLSIRLFRTIHPLVIGTGTGGMFAMSAPMTHTFLFCLLAFSALFAALFWRRTWIGVLQEGVEQAETLEESA